MYRVNAQVTPDEDWALQFAVFNAPGHTPHDLTGCTIFVKLKRSDDVLLLIASTATNGYVAITNAANGLFSMAIPNSAFGGLTNGEIITGNFILQDAAGNKSLLFQLVVKCKSSV